MRVSYNIPCIHNMIYTSYRGSVVGLLSCAEGLHAGTGGNSKRRRRTRRTINAYEGGNTLETHQSLIDLKASR